jgi:hypothetical protein
MVTFTNMCGQNSFFFVRPYVSYVFFVSLLRFGQFARYILYDSSGSSFCIRRFPRMYSLYAYHSIVYLRWWFFKCCLLISVLIQLCDFTYILFRVVECNPFLFRSCVTSLNSLLIFQSIIQVQNVVLLITIVQCYVYYSVQLLPFVTFVELQHKESVYPVFVCR